MLYAMSCVQARHPDSGFDTDGFGTLSPAVDGRDWRTVTEYRLCCGEWLSKAAPPLAGQLVFPDGRPTAKIIFSFGRTRHKETQRVTLSLRNQLSPTSATTLLHFIRHTEELYFDRVTFPGREQIENFGPLNPSVLSAVAGKRGRGWLRVRSVGEGFREAISGSRLFTDTVKEMMVFGGDRHGTVKLQSSFTAAYADTASYLLTQGGRCVVGEVHITFQLHDANAQAVMGFFERLVQVSPSVHSSGSAFILSLFSASPSSTTHAQPYGECSYAFTTTTSCPSTRRTRPHRCSSCCPLSGQADRRSQIGPRWAERSASTGSIATAVWWGGVPVAASGWS